MPKLFMEFARHCGEQKKNLGTKLFEKLAN